MTVLSLASFRQGQGWLLAGLSVATLLSWWYLVHMANGMPSMQAPMPFRPWATLSMWVVMMIAMMLPSAAPGIMMLAASRPQGRHAALLPYLFTLGYLLAWVAYSALATAAQWGLHASDMLTPAQALRSELLAGLMLAAAGIFQWTPWKQACLRYCRSPLGMLAEGFPGTAWRTLTAGMRLGVYCAGCCWALMALMFVGGVMSLAWMAALTLIILLEKLISPWQWLANLLGLGLVALGVLILVG
ncbi:DUF2182 domain-containing protein [Halomonas sabkhae]|uniref:DUF2182 domain-containing protein n=1 Tax=Halomonas sabkhae TaxID=626223 RepID=UPI0025B45DDC|nr:DUF2182 domain-containing protein [Halomonas sabkhae]MDN3525956.1 DUF2182 domain-containing protein [Halomonas sabkhae]